MRSRLACGSIREFPPHFRPINLWMLSSTNGSTRERPTCSSISFKRGVAFRLRPWFTVIPSYRYQRFPGNPSITYENRLLLNFTLNTSRGPWRPTLRTLVEGRFPDDRPGSARLRFRPGIEYTLPLRTARPPVVVVSNEFFVVPWYNPFANGGSSFTQSRFLARSTASNLRLVFHPALLLIAVG